MAADAGVTAARAWASLRRFVVETHNPRKALSRALGITYFKIKILLYLERHPQASASALVQQFASDKTYISLILRDLEADGSLLRSADPRDRRSKRITLTEQGRARARQAAGLLEQPPAGLARLSPEELATLQRLLDKAGADG
ncbi:MarR family transcriptional regulator [Bordetella trematum]|uniref:MarR family winged helix-turn-helix transcriptional regulator n=1 Tax=Bordetella trematum TaxID=123899 RepID=UPI00052E9901|nr:MarR family transcriptional regulator [Bordetella trematum]SAI22209.1 MarR family transcriptional regulator [Bordetella trematum]SPU50237.1 MarR family transcriptional regulator [Bordetella trematum]VDH07980.1 MarR family [Bordetella trematum]